MGINHFLANGAIRGRVRAVDLHTDDGWIRAGSIDDRHEPNYSAAPTAISVAVSFSSVWVHRPISA